MKKKSRRDHRTESRSESRTESRKFHTKKPHFQRPAHTHPAHAPHRPIPQALKKALERGLEQTRDQVQAWAAEGLEIKAQAAQKKTFALDPWQQEAVDALVRGANVVVDAPTTAGKTKVVETYFANHLFDSGFRACYTCPVKSLSNDKVKEFRATFGKGYVGIATGDIKENLHAPLVVATLESYRNSLLGMEPDLDRSLVVFDEYHYIQDEGRGSAWEEAIILTPKSSQLLLLSASIANPEDFAKWIEQITNRPTVLVQVDKRPVPLVNMIFDQGQWYLSDHYPQTHLPKGAGPGADLSFGEIAKRLLTLEQAQLSPCLVYAGKRLACNQIAYELCEVLAPLSPEQSQVIRQKLQDANDQWQSLAFLDKEILSMIETYGVAYHHSGLAPAARLGVEHLIKDGHLRFCVATMGLSLGINFSVKSTVITDFSRPGESGPTPYSPSEVLQMRGRAGRRGMDPVGFSCWLTTQAYRKLAKTTRTKCESNLKTDPSTFLGLMCRGMTLPQIETFYKKSFLKLKNPNVNMNLVTQVRLAKNLNQTELPCQSAVHEFVTYQNYKTTSGGSQKKSSQCQACPLRKPCHNSIKGYKEGFLATLHSHLHSIGALDPDGMPSLFGKMARYFPQNGGLLFAKYVHDELIDGNHMLEITELIAALSLARFKEPVVPPDYQFPFSAEKIEGMLQKFYPIDLFPEYYDTTRFGMITDRIREFNPRAGWIIREWIEGMDWNTLTGIVTSKFFSVGDVTALIYRVASFLQSIHQAGLPHLGNEALELRRELLREPIKILL